MPNKPANSIATTAGWVNPTTGELLVSIRGLPDAVPYVRGKKNYTKEAAKVIAKPAREEKEILETSSEVSDTKEQDPDKVDEQVAPAPTKKKKK